MILRIEEIQNACGKILAAVDSNTLSVLTETLQLKTENKNLFISVTNREYFAQVKIPMNEEIDFHATVNANLFLKLISQITTDTIELNIVDTSLILKGNGSYKLPLIFDGENLLQLPEITINNATSEFEIDSNVLLSILQFNSKELSKGIISKPIQKLYYLDNEGCVTFTTGACVNTFTLDQPVKILLNDRLVKLFKLFKGEKVHFTLGYDAISDEIVQTKVKFETSDIVITAILSCDDSMLNQFPTRAVRARADASYPYSININREQLIQTICRLLLFSSANSAKDVIKPFAMFDFKKDSVVVYDTRKENKEEIYYTNSTSGVEDTYSALLDLNDVKNTLETCTEQYVTIHFGDGAAIVLSRGNIKNVIPECNLN